MPDVDLNFGLGDRIQLTFEVAWVRLAAKSEPPRYGVGQDVFGVKWRFYDNDKQAKDIKGVVPPRWGHHGGRARAARQLAGAAGPAGSSDGPRCRPEEDPGAVEGHHADGALGMGPMGQRDPQP